MLAMLVTPVLSQGEKFNYATVRASWSPPCVGTGGGCGSPAVDYVFQLRQNVDGEISGWGTYASAIEDTSLVLEIPLFIPVQARVAARDAQDRQGPWSLPSEWYVADFGPPGMPVVTWDVSLPTGPPMPPKPPAPTDSPRRD